MFCVRVLGWIGYDCMFVCVFVYAFAFVCCKAAFHVTRVQVACLFVCLSCLCCFFLFALTCLFRRG